MSGHIRHLSISHSPVFLVNSRLGHFSAPASPQGTPSPEVTGSILPSSLAVIHSSALGYSPTHLCRFTVRAARTLSASTLFSRSMVTLAVGSPGGSPYCRLSGSPLRPSTRNSVSARRFHFSVATSPYGPAAILTAVCIRIRLSAYR